MKTDQFRKFWHERFLDCPPLGYRLRYAMGDMWIRIHTLPDAKRYPDNEAERAEIVSRHNSVLNSLLTSQDEIMVLLPIAPGAGSNLNEAILGSNLVPEYLYSFLNDDCEVDDLDGMTEPWQVYGCSVNWESGCLDHLLLSVAIEDVSNALIVSMSPEFAYHPYDGGGDLFVLEQGTRNSIRRRFAAWLSTRKDGL